MKVEIKKWKEYKKWIDKKNRNIVEEHTKRDREMMKEYREKKDENPRLSRYISLPPIIPLPKLKEASFEGFMDYLVNDK